MVVILIEHHDDATVGVKAAGQGSVHPADRPLDRHLRPWEPPRLTDFDIPPAEHLPTDSAKQDPDRTDLAIALDHR